MKVVSDLETYVAQLKPEVTSFLKGQYKYDALPWRYFHFSFHILHILKYSKRQ